MQELCNVYLSSRFSSTPLFYTSAFNGVWIWGHNNEGKLNLKKVITNMESFATYKHLNPTKTTVNRL